MGTDDDLRSRSKGLEDLSLKQLLGSLITHHMMLGEQSKKKKDIVLEATIKTEEGIEDEDMALITRNIKCFLNKILE